MLGFAQLYAWSRIKVVILLEMQNKKWIVISGTTSSGKTTIVNFFENLGYPIVPDITRVYVETLLNEGYTIENIRNNKNSFFSRLHDYRLWWEEELKRYISIPIVFDRAVPETVAYARVDNFEEKYFLETANNRNYACIFIPHPLAFKSDGIRTNNPKRRLLVFTELKSIYGYLGYKTIELPVLAAEARESLIQKYLETNSITPDINSSSVKNYINKILLEFIKKIKESKLIV